MDKLSVVRSVILVFIILVGLPQMSMAGNDPLEPDIITFIEYNRVDNNKNILEKPEPIYKDGVKLATNKYLNADDGWKFVEVPLCQYR